MKNNHADGASRIDRKGTSLLFICLLLFLFGQMMSVDVLEASEIKSSDLIEVGPLYVQDFTIFKVDGSEKPDVAKVGDTVEVAFRLSEIGVDGAEESRFLTDRIQAEPPGGNTHEGSSDLLEPIVAMDDPDGSMFKYTLKIGEQIPLESLRDNQEIDLGSLLVTDKDGRRHQVRLPSSGICYYAPLTDTIVADSLQISSDGQSQKVMKNGDTLTLTFATTHPVDVELSRNAGQIVDCVADEANMSFSASICLNGLQNQLSDNRSVPFSVKIADAAGNVTRTVTQDDAPSKYWYADIEIEDLVIQGSAVLGHVKNGDSIEVGFRVNHPVMIRRARIGGQDIELNCSDGLTWSGAYYVRPDLFFDQVFLAFDLEVEDEAGNQACLNSAEIGVKKIQYHAPLTVTNVSVRSTNQMDADRFAKDNDTIIVSFQTNHEACPIEVMIADKPTIFEGEGTSWSFSRVLSNGELADLSGVPFSFRVTDKAGGLAIFRDQSNVCGNLTYFAPLEILDTKMVSDSPERKILGQGSTVTVVSDLNHQAQVVDGVICERATFNTVADERVSSSVTLDRRDAEGLVLGHFIYADPAGNTVRLECGGGAGSFVFDATPPIVDWTPNLSGYTNQSVTMTISYSDPHLDAKGLSLMINGVEWLSSVDRGNAEEESMFRKVFTLEGEGEYEISATATDKAGNVTTVNKRALLTIDKTMPTVKLASGFEGLPLTVPVGFLISDFLTVDEAHIKDVRVTVSDENGVGDWDISRPIDTEGKKIIFVMVTDLAGNQSMMTEFEIHVDKSRPAVTVFEDLSRRYLNPGTNVVPFMRKARIQIQPEKLWAENTLPDRLTAALLTGPDGKTNDLLQQSAIDDGGLTVVIDDVGSYDLMVSAVDSVGNVLEPVLYKFSVAGSDVIQRAVDLLSFQNIAWFYFVLLAILLIIPIRLLCSRQRRR